MTNEFPPRISVGKCRPLYEGDERYHVRNTRIASRPEAEYVRADVADEALAALKYCVGNIDGIADGADIPSTAIRDNAMKVIAKLEGGGV